MFSAAGGVDPRSLALPLQLWQLMLCFFCAEVLLCKRCSSCWLFPLGVRNAGLEVRIKSHPLINLRNEPVLSSGQCCLQRLGTVQTLRAHRWVLQSWSCLIYLLFWLQQ